MRSTKEMKLHVRWKEKNEQRIKQQKYINEIIKLINQKEKKEKVKQDV